MLRINKSCYGKRVDDCVIGTQIFIRDKTMKTELFATDLSALLFRILFYKKKSLLSMEQKDYLFESC